MLITDEYRALNSRQHENPDFGTTGHLYHDYVVSLIQQYQSRDILDYGCGKRTLEKSLGFNISNYDPSIPNLRKSPKPHDILVSTDVLEHVEPKCLSHVLDDMKRVCKKAAFLSVATGAAINILEDGRNAHLIQQPLEWWLPKIWARFKIKAVINEGYNVLVFCEAKG